MRKRGIRVLPGGDYGIAFNSHGKNAKDLELFVELFGYTPMEMLMSATKLGGEIMLMGDELGQVRKGFLAELLVVKRNPLDDIRILQNKYKILAILKDGKFHKSPVENGTDIATDSSSTEKMMARTHRTEAR